MKLSSEDRLSILDVVARYGQTLTNNDPEGFAALYAEDALLEIGWSNVPSSRLQGRKAVRDWAADAFRLMPATRIARLWTSTPVIEVDRETAVATSSYLNVSVTGDILATGTLKTTLRNVDGNWLIIRLLVTIDGSREETAAKEALALARSRHS